MKSLQFRGLCARWNMDRREGRDLLGRPTRRLLRAGARVNNERCDLAGLDAHSDSGCRRAQLDRATRPVGRATSDSPNRATPGLGAGYCRHRVGGTGGFKYPVVAAVSGSPRHLLLTSAARRG